MRKFYLTISSTFISTILFFKLAFASATSTHPVSSYNDVIGLFTKAAKWMYSIFFLVVIIYILLAAFTYMSAGDKSENVQKATKMLMNAVIAIIVALVSGSFILLIKHFLASQ